jgi:hypothetical protein
MNRREFIGTIAGAAATTVIDPAFAVSSANKGTMWAFLVHFGFNNWYDTPLDEAPKDAKPHYLTRCMADHVRFDEELWKEVSPQLPKAGINIVIIDLGEFMKFPSHPELAVKGSWEPEKMQAEKKRLEAMGLEVIPKLNFSATHDSWLKDYQRMLSTQKYYQVCSDVIRDTIEIFGTPRYFHLGYDEETAGHQSAERYRMCIIRQGDLWWHDFLWFVKQVEDKGVRPWIWSDYIWGHKDEFLKRMPRSVLQSNWYYHGFKDVKPGSARETYIKAYDWLEAGGFDQVPTGSNWDRNCPQNMQETIEYCKKAVAPERLKGFMMASWARTQRSDEAVLKESVDIIGKCISAQS